MDIKNESWRALPGQYADYETSDFGRIKRKAFLSPAGHRRKAKIMSLTIRGDGTASKKDTDPQRKSHGLYARCQTPDGFSFLAVSDAVALAYLHYDPDFHTIKFKDENPLNARLDNLYLVPKTVDRLKRKINKLNELSE
ncbi:MAG: hypothetical protein RIB57_07805 [Pelagibacterium sp.]|uniref:hypothetical protein n=1 Tax=Pelagibacterium sp. TaxID=1967288 RepID=UPI0032F05883